MKHLVLIGVLGFVGCGKPAPTYNPFDDVYEVSFRSLINDGCDTVLVECGYYNMTKSKEEHSVFYQFYENEQEVLAKGLSIILDTIFFSENPTEATEDSIELASYSSPVDTGKVDRVLSEYGLTRIDRANDQSKNIWKYKDLDSREYELGLSLCSDWTDSTMKLIRTLDYYNINPNSQ